MDRTALNTALDKLDHQNIRLTPQRLAVLEYVYASESHPTVDEIYRSLITKYRHLSVATVYNNLRVFKKLGLMKEFTVGDSCRRYEAATTEHYHVICTSCGVLADVQLSKQAVLKAQIKQATGFEIDQAEMHGLCPACLNKKHTLSAG